VITGNTFDKYRSTNPIHRRLMRGFFDALNPLFLRSLSSSPPTTVPGRPIRVLEIGCGPGDLAERMLAPLADDPRGPTIEYTGIDIGPAEIEFARVRLPTRPHLTCNFLVADAQSLPFDPASFDLVLACEVLEHLPDPAASLGEIERVCTPGGHVIVSVPWEPVWRLLNLARGAYIGRCGNTPVHIQHFSRRMIRGLVATRLTVLVERHPLPWTMLLAQLRSG
jgi:ubiquinone/menaquinone biosynthesis C-methylase UbiE